MTNWINAQEQMPPTKKLVLVVVDQGITPSQFICQRIGFYTKGNEVDYDASECQLSLCDACDANRDHFLDEGWYEEIEWQGNEKYNALDDVTHWQHLPPYPERL